MALPTFNSFSLSDSTYIPETIEHRTRATRRIESEVISRRIGKKLTNTQIQEKVIQIEGKILANTPTALQTAVDELHRNLSDIEGTLIIEAGRSYLATAERIRVPDRKYNQTIASFEVQFVCVKPYSEGSVQIAGFVIPSGQNTLQFDMTISGSAPNRPIFRFTMPSGQAGNSPVVNIQLQYAQSANTVTVSGQSSPGDEIALNYDRYLVTKNGSNIDFTGQMEDIFAGDTTFVVTISGRNDGMQASIEYSPRYY